jgi:hypothetical protein
VSILRRAVLVSTWVAVLLCGLSIGMVGSGSGYAGS